MQDSGYDHQVCSGAAIALDGLILEVIPQAALEVVAVDETQVNGRRLQGGVAEILEPTCLNGFGSSAFGGHFSQFLGQAFRTEVPGEGDNRDEEK